MISLKMGGIILAAFIAGAFVASPELRAYAANTVFSSDIVDGQVKTQDLANGAVTNAKIAPSAVTTSKIHDGAVKSVDIGDGEVRTADIANGAVTTPKIADGSVSLDKFSTGVADSLKGTNGESGINCWDLNGNRVNDTSEDTNHDNAFNALDCQGTFRPNSAPIVNAGDDQEMVGTSGCGSLIVSQCVLACSFDLSGTVTDDAFTGYLAHKWTGAPVGFGDSDQLATVAIVSIQSPDPITSPINADVTLTANDGILVASDLVNLTCDPPAA